ncbi:unnamed protein product [Porites evermanni]|uniref:XK-related protein n=1 Tax=Porites evermanni TaxID=104178 RepID=A0ABN8SS29_9CNID|nr:unnamed protein product [Porites evermanni]
MELPWNDAEVYRLMISKLEVKWYDTFVLLFVSVLAVVDPVTDILTLREFYLKDHKIWFGVGLAFVVLPSFILSVTPCYLQRILSQSESKRSMGLIPCVLFRWNPLSLAYMRFKAFILCSSNFKTLWQNETLEDDYREKIRQLIIDAYWFGRLEAFYESVPQFIIQLHAIVVLQEQVSTTQIISLCASLFSITWTFTDDSVRKMIVLEGARKTDSKCSKFITTVVFYLSWLFHVSSRLLAITFFTVGFKWWAIAVFVFNFIVLVAFYIVWGADIMIILTGLNHWQEPDSKLSRAIFYLLRASFRITLIGYSPEPQIFAKKNNSFLLIRALPLFF